MEEEVENPEWEIEQNKDTKLLEQFTDEFFEWVDLMKRYSLLQAGGYPFKKDDLSIIEWQALGILKRWEAKENHVPND